MARVPDLVRFCRQHDLAMIRVADLARHRAEEEYLEWAAASSDIVPLFPGGILTAAGDFQLDDPRVAGDLVYGKTIP